MSVDIMSLVFNIKNQLTPTEKLILLELADHANDQGAGVWPGIDSIVDRTSLTRNPVRETLAWLTFAEILVTESEHSSHKSTRRRINVKYLEELKQAGRAGQEHMLLVASRSAWAEKKKLMAAEKAAKKAGLGSATHPKNNQPELQLGVSYSPSEGELLTPWGSATHPESLIKHQLNNKRESAPKITPVQLWKMVLVQLELEMKRGTFHTYVRPLSADCLTDNNTLVIKAPDVPTAQWVSDHLGKTITRLLEGITMAPAKLQVIV